MAKPIRAVEYIALSNDSILIISDSSQLLLNKCKKQE